MSVPPRTPLRGRARAAARSRLVVATAMLAAASLIAACGGDGGSISKSSGGDDGAPATTAASTEESGAGAPNDGAGRGPKGNADDPPADSEKNDDYTYQDDVVFVGGGEKAVVSASDDGLTYRLDGDAPGVRDIKKESVLFVSSMVAGRVADIGEQDGDVTVLLAPIQITDLIRDGVIEADHTFNDDDSYYQELPGLPAELEESSPDGTEMQGGTDRPIPSGPTTGGEAEPGTLDEDATMEVGTSEEAVAGEDPTVGKLHGRERPQVIRTADAGDEPIMTGLDDDSDEIVVKVPQLFSLPEQNDGGGAGAGGAGSGAAGSGGGAIGPRVDDNKRLPSKMKARFVYERDGWEFEPSAGPDTLGLTVTRVVNDSLKVSVDVGFKKSDLRVIAKTVIKDSGITSNDYKIFGLEGIYLSLAAGSATGAAANKKIKLDIPLPDIKGPFGTTGVNYLAKPSISITTAIGGNNSTLTAGGEWALTGPIGVSGGEPVVPGFSTTKSIVDSIAGIALAPSGITVGYSVLLALGVGTPAFMGGPAAKLSMDFGVVNGSALGAALARCHAATFDLWVGVGVGVFVDSSVKEFLEEYIGKKTKISFDLMRTKNWIHRAVVVPDVPLCAGAP